MLIYQLSLKWNKVKEKSMIFRWPLITSFYLLKFTVVQLGDTITSISESSIFLNTFLQSNHNEPDGSTPNSNSNSNSNSNFYPISFSKSNSNESFFSSTPHICRKIVLFIGRSDGCHC